MEGLQVNKNCNICGVIVEHNLTINNELICKSCAFKNTLKTFFSKVIRPLLIMSILLFIAYSITSDNHIPWLLAIAAVPYGIFRMRLWLVGRNQDVSGGISILAFNIFCGGLLGLVFMARDIIIAIFYCITTVFKLIKIATIKSVLI